MINDNATVPAAITAGSLLNNTGGGAPGLGTATVADGDSFTVNGKTITFKAGAAPLAAAAPTGYGIDAGAASVATDGNGNSMIYIGASSTTSTATVGDILRAVDLASGVRSSVVASGVATTALTPARPSPRSRRARSACGLRPAAIWMSAARPTS